MYTSDVAEYKGAFVLCDVTCIQAKIDLSRCIDLVWSNYLANKLVKSIINLAKNFGSDHQELITTILNNSATPPKKWARPAWDSINTKLANSNLTTLLKPITEKLKHPSKMTDDTLT